MGRRLCCPRMPLMQIERLTTTEFRESLFAGDHPAMPIVAVFSPHHLSMAGGLTAFDIRDRARDWEGLWPLPLKPRPPTRLIPKD